MFHTRTLLDDADLSSPSGRDRALDEVVGVIAAMPDSITREELTREVGDRLDADPGLVGRRIAAVGRGRDTNSHTETAGSGDVAKPETPRQLSTRERRELGLLAMCVKLPAEGREILDRLTDEHFSSPTAARAREWLGGHLEEPMRGLGRDDDDLLAYLTQVMMQADREPASREAMEPASSSSSSPRSRPGSPPQKATVRAPGRASAHPRRADRGDRPSSVIEAIHTGTYVRFLSG